MARNPRVSHLPILNNPYGPVDPSTQQCRVSGRVSPEDHAFLKVHFPFLPNSYDIIVSNLYAHFMRQLRATIPTDAPPAILGASDPLYVTLADVLARCTSGGSADAERDNPSARASTGGAGELSEAMRVLEAECPNPKSRDEGGADEDEEGERFGCISGRVVEESAVDVELSSLLGLLKS